MSKLAKALTAAAGNAGGDNLYVEDVFSTYLYTGNGTSQTITNDIDLAGEGGLVWLKNRDAIQSHGLFDTERTNGASYFLSSDLTGAEYLDNGASMTFNSDGFSLGLATYFGGAGSGNAQNYASWTFRKAEKFFDVVTYTGDGVQGREIAHNLGSTPNCIIVKKTNASRHWAIYHSGIGATKYLFFTTTGAGTTNQFWDDTTPTDSVFTVGNNSGVNALNDTYVAYLFASDAGGFGADGSESIIKCGSAAATGLTTVDCGFEPQWVLIKSATVSNSWYIFDSMRGLHATGVGPQTLNPNLSGAEYTESADTCNLTSTGFTFNSARFNGNATYIYIAIRRPMKTPESGTEVFDLGENRTSIGYQTIGTIGPIDMCMSTQVPTPFTNYHWAFTNRLVGGSKFLASAYTQAEATAYQEYDTNTGVINTSWFTNGGLWYNFKRATGFFDVVAWTGDGVNYTHAHNLGVVPELMILKTRGAAEDWWVYHKDIGADYRLSLQSSAAKVLNTVTWQNTAPTSAEYSFGNRTTGRTYISYLFATVAGVSKVFSVTKSSGSNANVDCGFSAGARFILLKRTDSTGDWYVWDSVRGIVSGNDPYLLLNSTAAEVTTTDYIDPLASGFTIVDGGLANGDYIGLAIA